MAPGEEAPGDFTVSRGRCYCTGDRRSRSIDTALDSIPCVKSETSRPVYPDKPLSGTAAHRFVGT
jgi:hypothetical protein